MDVPPGRELKIQDATNELKHVSTWDDFLKDSPIDVRDYPSLIHMLKYHVDKTPDKVLLYWPSPNYRSFELLTTREVWDLGDRYYAKMKEDILKNVPTGTWIGVLLEDNRHIWWTILALLRADVNALLINYKQSAVSIQNLMEKTGAKILLTTRRIARTTLRDVGDGDGDASSPFRIVVQNREELDTIRTWPPSNEELRKPKLNELEEARFCLHSSGSTRLPSPIYLPNSRIITDSLLMYIVHYTKRNPADDEQRTLVISPTAHMLGFTYAIGATMITAFTSVYPLSPHFPPTVPEVLRTIELADVKRLVTVPAIIEIIVNSIPDDSPQWRILQQLDTITFGGAQLPGYLGNKLLSKGIQVLPGYGSTESGINMLGVQDSKDPTALRMFPYASWKFVPQDGDEKTATVFELVILKNSFSLAPGVANCDEGFATSDLFMRGSKPGEWHHVGRKGDTLVHVNGEKTNAALMEEAILTNSKGCIHKASVLGSGRDSTALLVELDYDKIPKDLTEEERIDLVYEAARAANKMSPRHSKIMKNKIKVLPRYQHIPTSEKGNVQRFKLMQMFEHEIEELYSSKPHTNKEGDDNTTKDEKTKEGDSVIRQHKSNELKKAVSATLAAAMDVPPEDVFKSDTPIPPDVKRTVTSELEQVVGSPISSDIITDASTPNDVLNFLVTHFASDAQMSMEGVNDFSTTSLTDIAAMVAEALELDLTELQKRRSESLLDMGLTSLEATSVQRRLEEKFQIELPPNFVYDHATLEDLEKSLLDYLPSQRASRSSSARPTMIKDEDPFHYKETGALQKKYCDFISDLSVLYTNDIMEDRMKANYSDNRVVMITGASGHLGVHMVKAAIEDSRFKEVICLLRGNDLKKRMQEAFESRRFDITLLDQAKVRFYKYDSRDQMMGIPREEFLKLQNEVTDVIHNAWKVNFNIRVRDYEADWLKSTWYMILFCCSGAQRKSLNFISSVSSIANYQETDEIPEDFLGDAQLYMALPMGYAQSKFVAEAMLAEAQKTLGLTCRIFRCGQICGDTEHGVWKQEELVPIVTVKGGGSLHMIPENLVSHGNLIPVDIAGRSIIEIIGKNASRLVFHMTNPKGGTWIDWLDALQEAGLDFERADGYKFLKTLKEHPENECNLLYGVLEGSLTAPRKALKPPLASVETERVSEVLQKCPPMNAELAEKFLSYWRSTGFLA